MDSTSFATFHKDLEPIVAGIVQDFMDLMKQHGLSTHQIHALMYIYHAGQCQVSDVGALADVSNAAASQLVERLVQQELVERQEDPANRRTKIVRLSDKGMRLIQDSLPLNRVLVEAMASLSAEELQTVHAALAILAQAARRLRRSRQEKDKQHA